jgi:hypothetical protein
MRYPPRRFPAIGPVLTLVVFLVSVGIQPAAAQNQLRQMNSPAAGPSQLGQATARLQATSTPPSSIERNEAVRVNAPPVGSGFNVTRDPAVMPAGYEANSGSSHRSIDSASNLQPMSQMLDQLRNEPVTRQIRDRAGLAQPRADQLTDWAAFPPLTERDTDTASELESNAENAAVDAEVATESFQELVKQLAFSTLFVLFFGVGVIVIAKVWTKTTGKTTRPKAAPDQFEVVTELKLAGKSCLTLVEIDSQRLVIAADPTGIKSVVPLNESFADRMAALDPEFGQPSVQDRQLPVSPGSSSVAEDQSDSGVEPKNMTYSLGSIGNRRKSRPPASENPQRVQSDMEAALTESGLKELILKSLREAS